MERQAVLLGIFRPLPISSEYLIVTKIDPASGDGDKQEISPALSAAFGQGIGQESARIYCV